MSIYYVLYFLLFFAAPFVIGSLVPQWWVVVVLTWPAILLLMFALSGENQDGPSLGRQLLILLVALPVPLFGAVGVASGRARRRLRDDRKAAVSEHAPDSQGHDVSRSDIDA